ncbi:MAG TPA: hypothetical protein GXX73_14130 [Clostridium sp.]|nr:hypothetical protein [Clostridium sp.]
MNMFDFLKNPSKTKEPLEEEALKKIKEEIEQNNDEQINFIGQILIKHLKENAVAEKILNPEKSIKNCIEKMHEFASTKIKERGYNINGMTGVFLTYDEGMEIILDYFEIGKKEEVDI